MYRDTALANSSPRSPQDDASLLALVRRGDEHALTSLYDRYARLVYSVALRVLRDATSAEDVLMDVFLDVWRTPERFIAVRGSFVGWLTIVTRNHSVNQLRRKRGYGTIDDISLAAQYDLASEAERNTLAERARSVVFKLPADQRKTLEMAFFDGLTHGEISEMTADSESTVTTRVRSALNALRKAFLS